MYIEALKSNRVVEVVDMFGAGLQHCLSSGLMTDGWDFGIFCGLCNPFNARLVQHGENGLVFSSTED